ncbi:MAG: hypothetical protein SVU32_07495 [Candidatus Nanohaloarchaea archaeon]|nr:hypothetical protein [Candidatus Nanohaloarchaea archaeon]
MVKTAYKDDIDVLMIEEGDYDDFDRSLELGGFVLDLDSNDRFLGLEIIDATQKLALTADELSSIDDATISLDRHDDVLRVRVELIINGQRSTITSQYPQPATA